LSRNGVSDESKQKTASADGSSSQELSAYFLDLERLLDRMEGSTTHYQVLGLERSASYEQVCAAFQKAIELLYPQYSLGGLLPAQILSRIDRAFTKSAQSFSVLASLVRRRDYDLALASVGARPASGEPSSARGLVESSAPAVTPSENLKAIAAVARPLYMESSKSERDNRRRCERLTLKVPIHITGHDRRAGRWNEMAETIDVSRTGLTLRMKRRVRHGNILFLTLPMPVKLRSHGFSEPGYKVYAVVRRIEPPRQGGRVIGLEFMGDRPPAGYLEKPWAIFRTKRWGGIERRRAARVDRAEAIRIEYFLDAMNSTMREEARTENIGRHGLRVAVKAAPPEFDLIRISSPARRFESFAALRNRYVGKDGVERLCLQFIDREWPL
jgi:hypothetical protein